MEEKILVAYASTYGSTREVAEAVAAALSEAGVDVDILPMKAVRSLAAYRAVVLGAPLYILRWHSDARRFVARHRQALAGLPAAVFALGPFNDKPDEWAEVRSELDKELAHYPWLTPAAVAVFGGKFDPTALRFPWNLVPAMKNMPPSDIRDFAAIRAWALGLIPLLAGRPVPEAAR